MAAVKEATTESVDLREAIDASLKFSRKVFSPADYNVSIEEIDKTEDEKFWLITLGFDPIRGAAPKTLDKLLNPPKTAYKVFKVNAKTGEVVSMKIRQVE
jgi:hypothetical protein